MIADRTGNSPASRGPLPTTRRWPKHGQRLALRDWGRRSHAGAHSAVGMDGCIFEGQIPVRVKHNDLDERQAQLTVAEAGEPADENGTRAPGQFRQAQAAEAVKG